MDTEKSSIASPEETGTRRRSDPTFVRSSTWNTSSAHHERRLSPSSSHDAYKSTLSTFVPRKDGRSLFSGLHYEALSRLFDPPGNSTISRPGSQPREAEFAVLHELPAASGARRQVHTLTALDEIEETFRKTKMNKILFLRGYPATEWLSRIGSCLGLDYEFLFQHLANGTQLNLSDMFCLPPISVIGTGTIQLTFTSIGMWDNHKSGSNLEMARIDLAKEMKSFTDDVNVGRGIAPCGTMVRSFSVHDLKHFSIEQQLTIKLLQFQNHWTIVVWSDCGTSLSQSHRGPWKQIRDSHAGSLRFISWPLDFTNRQIRHVIKTTQEESVDTAEKDQEGERDPLEQGFSLLCDELGQNEDSTETMASNASPFHALNTIFQFLAVSEYQFLNLMEEKTEIFGKDANHGIGEIQRIKKQVDAHLERLQDVLDVIKNRGGRGWPLVSKQPHHTPSSHSEEHSDEQSQRRESSLSTSYQPQSHREESSQHGNKKNNAKAKADDAAICLERKFEKLIRRAQAVSSGCQDEMEKLSNESVVREAQRGKEQAEAVAKVTFIAAVFVPLAFTTSIFGMDLQQLNGSGADITTWIYVVVPVMIISVVAWAVNGERIGKVWEWIRRHIVHERKGLKENRSQMEPV